MEKANLVLTAISTVGFPIVITLILLWMIYNQDKLHKDEMGKITDALNNNTIALTKLTDKIHV